MVKQNFVENKIVYPSELLESKQKMRHSLYLRVGNMKDILQLTPWDFEDIFDVAYEQTPEGSKEPKPLKQSQKEMIEKQKRIK